MYKPQNITATSLQKNKRIEVPGAWDSSGNFRSQELLFKEPGDYNMTNDQGITRIFTCPGFKFACSIVSILNAYCIKNQSGITAGLELYNDTEIDNLKFNYGLDQKILVYEKGSRSTELKNLSIKKEGSKIVTFIPFIPGILEIKTFEVIHKKCLGKRYIYTRVDCSEFANLSSIDTNALKCGGLLDLKDRVRCRINLESEKEEYQNFYPEECRTHKNPAACFNLYKKVSDCWDLPASQERINCLKEKIELAQSKTQQEKNEHLLTLIKLRFYNLEEQAEILQEHGLLDLESLIEFVAQVELKKQAFNLAKNKEEMKQIIQDVRDLWKELMTKVKK